MSVSVETKKGVDYYDQRWIEESEKISGEELLRISRILYAFTLIAQREKGKISGTAIAKRRICDLGCGKGRIASYLSPLGNITGIDYSAAGVAMANVKYPEVNFEVGDATKYRSAEPFDVIVSSEVIEHVPEKSAFADTCRENLKTGGYLILTCPNGRYLSENAGGKISNQPIEEWPTKQELLSLFKEGFERIHYDTFRTDYFQSGINRLTNNHKLRSFLTHHSLNTIYDAFLGKCGLGIYQYLILRRV